jgi:hypothetical protein
MALTEQELKSVIASEVRQSTAYEADAIAQDRAKALAYYEGEAEYELSARPGRSSVVDRSVLEAVEWTMPMLMDIFNNQNAVVQFEADNDQEAEQATEMVRHVIYQDNDGYGLIHDFAKDALLQKTGVLKWAWQEDEEVEKETVEGLDDASFINLVSDPSVEIVEHSEEPDELGVPVIGPDGMPVMPMTHDVTYKRTTDKAQVKIYSVPPEEFLINKRARSIDDAYFVAHRVRKSYSDLVAEGYDKEDVDKLPWNSDAMDLTEEAEERWDDLDFFDTSSSDDKAQRTIWVYECYINIDEDEDGIAELKRIIFGGGPDNLVILENEPADHKPFAIWSPIRLPHRVFGLSLADLTMDLQAINTMLYRGGLDGLYLANNPRNTVIENQVNLDDLLTSAPGGVVRMKRDGAVQPMITQNPAPQAIQMMEYVGKTRTMRTGISEQTVGLSPESVANTSATAAQLQSNSTQMRVKLIARNMADGMRQLYNGIFKTLRKHQDGVRQLRIGKELVPIDPKSWSSMRLRVTLSDNMVDKGRTLAYLSQVLGIQREAIATGTQLAAMPQVYNTLDKMVTQMELGQAEEFFTNPAMLPPQPPKPDPAQAQAQAEMQMKQQEMQMKAQLDQQQAQLKAQTDQQIAQERAVMDQQIAQQKAQSDAELARFKAELDAAVEREKANMQMAIEQQKLALQRDLKEQELAAEIQLEQMRMASGSPAGQGNIPEVM